MRGRRLSALLSSTLAVAPALQTTAWAADLPGEENLEMVNAPLIEISSSFIRDAIKQGKDIRHFLPQPVWEYLDRMNFYR